MIRSVKRKRREARRSAPVDPRRRDPLNATPVVAPGVDARTDGMSLVQLRRHVPAQSGVSGMLRRVFKYKRHVQVYLDECGTAFWQRIDGERDLHAIERDLRTRFGWELRHSEAAVVQFTELLMLRGMICLRLPGQETAEGVGSDV